VERLGDILLARGATTPGQLRDALEGQVLYGDRLGTNLLEVAGVTEEELAQALGRQHGCPALWGEFAADAGALDLLGGARADKLDAVPVRLEGRHLTVLVADPRDLRKIDELSFATGKEVRPVVVAESRLWEQLRRHYRLFRPLRGVDAQAPRRPGREARAAAQGEQVDLMDEAAFNALYDRVGMGAPTPPPVPGLGLARPEGLVTSAEVLAALQREATAAAGDDGRAISLTPAGGQEPPPLSFDEAARALAGVADRGAIARIVLRCARSRLARAVLLTVRQHFADGWEGLGVGLSAQAVARLRVPVDQPGVLQTVVSSRAHFLGPLQKTPANVRFLRALGGGAPKNSFAMPVLARGRVVNVLYADNGRGALVDADGVGELLILAARISQSYDQLLSRAR
jgi:hypothetical protein